MKQHSQPEGELPLAKRMQNQQKTPVPVIVATNYKGGVGKTTTSRVLAQGILERPDFTKGLPVLIIDLDPQGNTSSRWNLLEIDQVGNAQPKPHPAFAVDTRSSICDLWLEVIGASDQGYHPVPYETGVEGIHCIPAHEPLMLAANRLDDQRQHQMAQIMLDWIRSPQVAQNYCCVIIDTQPSKAPLINIALIAGTHCYVPFIPEPQSIEGVYSIITYINNRQGFRLDGTELKLLGVLPNMYQSRVRLHFNNLNALRSHDTFGDYVMPFELGRRTAYSATDDAFYQPGAVTQMPGPINIEAQRFADYVISAIQETQA